MYTSITLLVALIGSISVSGFVPIQRPSRRISVAGVLPAACTSSRTTRSSSTAVCMGLYDEPLPPRPPPRKKPTVPERSLEEIQEEQEEVAAAATSSTEVLFSFTDKGKEVRNLLPSLGRFLTSGIECYYEATDRLVVNLVDKTGCNPVDACWALEACKGDISEAWVSISTARRMRLSSQRDVVNAAEEDWDIDSFEVELEEEFEQRKVDRKAAQKAQNRDDFFRGGDADDKWLPMANPNPVDDEPWFTG